jgi:hypothetical protein
MFAVHSPPGLAAFHAAASLIGLAIGLFVLRDIFASRRPAGLAALFLGLMAAANLSGFLFPSRYIGVGHVSGAISVAALAVTIVATAARRMTGPWAAAYVVGTTTMLYCDSLIGVFMVFGRVPFLHHSGQGSVLGIQLLVLGIFVALGVRGIAAFHPEGQPDDDHRNFATVRRGGFPAGL